MQEACGMVRKTKKAKKAKQREDECENAPDRCRVLPNTPAFVTKCINMMRLRRSRSTYNPLQQSWTCRPRYWSLAVAVSALAPEEKWLLLEAVF